VGGVLHRAGPGDLDDLVTLAGQFCHLRQRAFDRDRVVGGLRPLLTDDTFGQVWLVHDPEHPGEPAGYAVLTWGWSVAAAGRECRLDELHVRARGNGLAARVLAELLEVALAGGAVRILLETEAHDRRAREFFGAAGFDLADSVYMSIKDPALAFPPAED
jgi:GNAT superfamily N-acetyltransferase